MSDPRTLAACGCNGDGAKLLAPTTNNYDYVNYVPNTQSNNYPSTMLISGVQEVSEELWLHVLIGHLTQTRLWEKYVF